MNVSNPIRQLPGGGAVPNVFGEPFETADGATVITVAKPDHGAAVGVFVIHGGTVEWKPATDENRIAQLAVLAGFASAVIFTLAMLRRPPWPDVHLTRELPEIRWSR